MLALAPRAAILAAAALVATPALPQTAGPASPAAAAPGSSERTSAPSTARVVPPSPDAIPGPSPGLSLNPVEAAQTESAAGASESPGNEFVIAPIPLANPTVGTGLGLAAVYTISRKSAQGSSPPTTLGAGGFYTNNGSWAGAIAGKTFLKNDRYRLTLATGLGRVNYDIFAEGPDRQGLPIEQEFKGGLGEFLFGLGKRWYIGLRTSYGATTVTLRGEASQPIPIPPSQFDVTLVALGLKGERDSRDNIFYPTAGSRLQLLINHNDTEFGGDFTFTSSTLTYSKYFKFSESMVLAVQGAGCYASGDAPFFGLCLFGTSNVLRGYTAGRHLDRWTLATQAEARWRFARRWIGTAFLGVGDVKPEYPASTDTEVLPAGGVGLQWIAASQNMITVRVDYAVGKDESHGFYVGIGQAF